MSGNIIFVLMYHHHKLLDHPKFCVLLLQVSCLWQGQYLLSVSLSGFINYLDVNNPNKHIRILKVIQMLHFPASALNLMAL
jgi:WD40 repeat protein